MDYPPGRVSSPAAAVVRKSADSSALANWTLDRNIDTLGTAGTTVPKPRNWRGRADRLGAYAYIVVDNDSYGVARVYRVN